MRALEIQETLEAMVEQKIPAFLWGPPGIGKSSIVKQISQQHNLDFIDLRLSLLDPTDLKGIPFYDKDSHRALWASPAFLPQSGSGILFLDELNTAPPAVQASAYQLILDRQIGEYTLPKGWAIIAAGNRENDRGVVYKMPSPLANRFVHLEMEVNVEDWRVWAFTCKIDARIIGYITYKKEDLFTFDATQSQKSFATPRSWEFVDAILKSTMKEHLLLNAISGAIGSESAVNFLAFAKVMHQLPDIESILQTGEGAYPDAVDVLYALASGLVSHFLHDQSEERLEALLNYVLELQSEFSVMVVQDLQRSGITMERSSAFERWVAKFSYLL
jgi:midasin (ATPase involved in ribosome maturation)